MEIWKATCIFSAHTVLMVCQCPPSMKYINPEHFVSLVEQTTDAVFVLRINREKQGFIIEYVNDAYLRKFSHTTEELIGKRLDEILSPEKYIHVNERLQACISSGAPLSYEETIVLDEQVFFSLSEAFPIPGDSGEAAYLIGLSKDITELKRQRDLLSESENTLQAILNSSDNVTLVIDAGYRVIYANTAAQLHITKMLGRQYKMGDSILDYLTKEQQETARGHFYELLQQKQKSYVFEHQFTYPDGEEAWYLRKYYPATDANGNYLGIVINSVNITQRKQHELEIQKHTDALREIAKIQSHEIRRPVANIVGLTELITPNKSAEELKEIITHLRKSAQELDEMVKQIVSKTYNPNS